MLLWILLAALYLVAIITLGLATLRKGHTVLFVGLEIVRRKIAVTCQPRF